MRKLNAPHRALWPLHTMRPGTDAACRFEAEAGAIRSGPAHSVGCQPSTVVRSPMSVGADHMRQLQFRLLINGTLYDLFRRRNDYHALSTKSWPWKREPHIRHLIAVIPVPVEADKNLLAALIQREISSFAFSIVPSPDYDFLHRGIFNVNPAILSY